ncbi:hypothetical protein HanOQP8_Chr08g0273331 [Helianthus annuus]|nr:hypothetical protein HanHA89_Chr08g0283671 [Helianthus annuus]KAJ0717992.1 hypothetical protein HanLR1_Chr08g0265751 [Helianthus annuus]KAJ0721234.1 hypothetical protein HanOQP8_Chr08g0273331 [Helianthus annuus]
METDTDVARMSEKQYLTGDGNSFNDPFPSVSCCAQKLFARGADEWFKHIFRGCGWVFLPKIYTIFFSRGAPTHPGLYLGPPLVSCWQLLKLESDTGDQMRGCYQILRCVTNLKDGISFFFFFDKTRFYFIQSSGQIT